MTKNAAPAARRPAAAPVVGDDYLLRGATPVTVRRTYGGWSAVNEIETGASHLVPNTDLVDTVIA